MQSTSIAYSVDASFRVEVFPRLSLTAASVAADVAPRGTPRPLPRLQLPTNHGYSVDGWYRPNKVINERMGFTVSLKMIDHIRTFVHCV